MSESLPRIVEGDHVGQVDNTQVPRFAGPSTFAQLPRLDEVDSAPALRLRGLMAVAPLGGDPVAAFGRLAGLAATLRAAHPGADWLSAGMSEDFEAAVAAGATHVRVGSAILGRRPALR